MGQGWWILTPFGWRPPPQQLWVLMGRCGLQRRDLGAWQAGGMGGKPMSACSDSRRRGSWKPALGRCGRLRMVESRKSEKERFF